MKKYKYKFSVIIPIYKVEEYLAETLDSVINQTIGFKENIQIIMVNDGSPDNSEKICKEYAAKYPNNITYVYQENAGVSAARNNGLNYVKGKYINFLDSDDKWEKDVFEKAWKMFEEHDEIDIIGVRQKFFEALSTYPPLDYKFKKDIVVDIFNYYDHIQLSVTSGFFRTDSIENTRFDTRVKYSEDAKFINEIIIKKEKIGLISSSVHLYRKRLSENSAIQVKNYRDDWYLVTPELCYKEAFKLSKEKYGYVIPYFQYYVAYDYQWRLKDKIPSSISPEVVQKYKELTKELFSAIDDNIMFEQKKLGYNSKIEFLKIKYGDDVINKIKYRKRNLYFKNLHLYSFNKHTLLNVNILDVKNKKITIKGLVDFVLPKENYEIYAIVNKTEKIKLELKDTLIGPKRTLDHVYGYKRGFVLELPEKDFESVYFTIKYKEDNKTILNIKTSVDAKISSKTKIFYPKNNKIYYFYKKRIKAKPLTLKNKLYFALRNLKFNLINKEYKVIIIRSLYHIAKLFNRKKIWIISDRPPTANDNGYALFKYMQNVNDKDIKTYFVIDKNSRDYEKAKSTGKILIYNSMKYKIWFMMADKIISSQADLWVNNPFGKKVEYYQDLYNNDFVFLQHGIIKDDLSVWLNQYEKNMKMFVTTTNDEYESILSGEYGYKKDVVKLTGLPRYDLLEDKKEKLIAITPTWRAEFAGKLDPKKGIRVYNPNFKASEYFEFYNNLINDKRLLKCMEEKGYKGVFIIHPSHYSNAKDFKGNDIIKLETNLADYSSLFSKASLLISDYSSVPFDFAYLKKPVIYTHFDKEKFFKNHIYTEGYFVYEKNGLGPVIYNYEDTVNKIIEYINNDCKLDEVYEKRIEKFYKYHDKNNSKRVYEEIKKI